MRTRRHALYLSKWLENEVFERRGPGSMLCIDFQVTRLPMKIYNSSEDVKGKYRPTHRYQVSEWLTQESLSQAKEQQQSRNDNRY